MKSIYKRGHPLCVLMTAFLLTMFAGFAAEDNPLPNPGFEEQATGWSWSIKEVTISPEAAQEGKAGLRIKVEEALPTGTSVTSSSLPVRSGQTVTLSFQARTSDQPFCGVYLFFFDASGKKIAEDAYKHTGGSPVLTTKETDGNWHACTLSVPVPSEAKSLSLWIHSWGNAKGTLDLDAFQISGLDKGIKAALPPAVKAAGKPAAADLSKLPPRKEPPLIVIKVDDLRPINGEVNGLWKKLDAYLGEKKIKYGIGMICKDLDQASPAFFDWVKTRQQSGAVEFWLHGWDHATHEENGVKQSEFSARSYEDQRKRFADAQAKAQEKLGFSFVTFGTPGGGSKGHFDAQTIRVMADDPAMKVWLYPQPLDKAGEALMAAGKVTILDRVWEVNLEGAVGVPDSNRFLQGYAKHPERSFFVLQGHPMSWSGSRFEEFQKIIEFLEGQRAVFLTPAGCAARVSTAKP